MNKVCACVPSALALIFSRGGGTGGIRGRAWACALAVLPDGPSEGLSRFASPQSAPLYLKKPIWNIRRSSLESGSWKSRLVDYFRPADRGRAQQPDRDLTLPTWLSSGCQIRSLMLVQKRKGFAFGSTRDMEALEGCRSVAVLGLASD